MEAAKLACASFLLLALCARGWTADNGLAAHYTFDEGRGDVLRDHSGHGNHGTIFGAQWAKLKDGYALAFDGEDDYVNCGNDKSLNLVTQCTVSLWFKPAAYQGGLVTALTGVMWGDARFLLTIRPGKKWDRVVWAIADGKKHRSGRGFKPELNAWQHVAWTFDGFRIRLYRDGIPFSGASQRFFLPDLAGQPILIGKSQGLGPEHFKGLITDVRMYNRALNQTELFHVCAQEAANKGKKIQPGEKVLVVKPRNLPEHGRVELEVDAKEFRPFREGMKIEGEIAGTSLKAAVLLDTSSWDYVVKLDAEKLKPGKHDISVRVVDGRGVPVGERKTVTVNWQPDHCRASRRRLLGPAPVKHNAPNNLWIVREGEPQATIVIPQKADKWTKRAADWLRAYILKATGGDLTITSDTAQPKGNIISVGHTQLLKKAGLTSKGFDWDTYRMVARGDRLFLFGRDDSQFDHLGPKGSCMAVVKFLEEFAGVRWFLPTPAGDHVPRQRNLAVPNDLDKQVTPAFAYSSGRWTYGTDKPGAFANHYRCAIKLRTYGGHSYYAWVPAKEYFEDHPEYFAFYDGKRNGSRNHLCTSNPDVKRMVLQGIRAEFDKGYDWVQLGQTDGFRKCECPKCEALDEYTNHYEFRPGYSDWYKQLKDYPCERLLLLHKWIADECRKSHPNKTVHLLVYGPTVWPSRNFDKWGDNVVAEMCSQSPEVIKTWKDNVRGMTGYVYWFDITLARGMGIHATPADAAATIRYLHEQNFIGLYQFPETNWGLSGPTFYIIGQLMGDPYMDYTILQEEYCLGIFGRKAGKTMNEFFTVLNNMPELKTHLWPKESIERLDALLRRASAQVSNDRQRQWLQLTRDHFDYCRFLSLMLHAYRAYKESPSDATWTEVKLQVDAFENLRHRILHYPDEHTRTYFPGHDPFCRFLVAPHLGRRGYYTSYHARKNEILSKKIPGTGFGWGYGGVDYPVGLDFKNPPHRARTK